ncbi:MAG: hypothetical protein A2355_09595, partial [Spirochaetes bacterium RIFOXYB1_FULL_32_8]
MKNKMKLSIKWPLIILLVFTGVFLNSVKIIPDINSLLLAINIIIFGLAGVLLLISLLGPLIFIIINLKMAFKWKLIISVMIISILLYFLIIAYNIVKRENNNLLFNIFLIFIVSSYFFLLIYKIGYLVTQNLSQLMKGLSHLKTGNLDFPIELHSQDELQTLADAFNNMRMEMKETRIQIDDYTKSLEYQVEARNIELKESLTIQYELNNRLITYSDTINKKNITIENDIKMAKKIQSYFIPSKSVTHDIAFLYKSMENLGGDFFDFIKFANPDLLGIFICDVSGHGVSAAFITAMVKSNLLQYAPYLSNPSALLDFMNINLIKQTMGNFLTAFYGIFNFKTKEFVYSNAGHNLPFIINKNGIKQFPSGFSSLPLAVL